MSSCPSWASSAARDQRGLARHRDAHRLDGDQREDRGVADVGRDVDDRREHAPSVIGRSCPVRHHPRHGAWRSGSSPARAPTRCRASRAPAPSRSRRRGARRSSRAARSPGADVLHVSRHEAGHARLSSQVTHRANIAALAQQGAKGVIAVTVCGAVDPSVELGSLICFDDLHFLANRLGDGELCTFFPEPGDPRRGHWIFEDPFSAELRAALLAGAAGGRACRCATAAATATSTARASTRRRRSAGSPPAASPPSRRPPGRRRCCAARLELPYALLGYATDYANGVQDEATPVQTLLDMMAASTETFAAVLAARGAARGGRRAVARRDRVPLRRLASAGRRGRWCAARPEIRSSSVAERLLAADPPRTRTPS